MLCLVAEACCLFQYSELSRCFSFVCIIAILSIFMVFTILATTETSRFSCSKDKIKQYSLDFTSLNLKDREILELNFKSQLQIFKHWKNSKQLKTYFKNYIFKIICDPLRILIQLYLKNIIWRSVQI